MRYFRPALWGLIAATSLAGCADISPPNWFHPGTAPEQRREAQIFDPYPEPQLIGPSMQDARPRDYQTPPAESARTPAALRKRFGNARPAVALDPATSYRPAPAPVYSPPPVYNAPPAYNPPPVYSPPPGL